VKANLQELLCLLIFGFFLRCISDLSNSDPEKAQFPFTKQTETWTS